VPRPQHRLAVLFDDAAWAEDLARTTDAGRRAASEARADYERDGMLLHDLRPCERHARDGTDLPNCAKVYLPPPAGPFGAVFRLKMLPDGLRLVYLAFGTRHHPRGSHAPTVYELAHQRLHGRQSAT
jgi:hypothetical protein